jgi:hypothetical protein
MIRKRTLRALRPFAAPAVALALVGVGAPLALADDDSDATATDVDRVVTALDAKGYTQVRDIEIDDGRFEVDAIHPEGHPVDLELDMDTLEIVHEKRD